MDKKIIKSSADQKVNNIDLLSELPLPVTVELAQINKQIGDIVSLHPGSIIEFDKTIDEPFDLLANGQKIGTCEVINIDDKFGIRVKTILKEE